MNPASARNSAQVPQATGDTQYNVRDAALRGASSAFSKPPVKPKPQVNTYTGSGNGALLAATKVGTGGTPRTATPSGSATPLRRDWTGGSTRSTARSFASPMPQPLSRSNSSHTLEVPGETPDRLIPSPSNIAAKLAAARYSPMKPIPQVTAVPVMSERDTGDRDVLPAPGSVGNVLARLDSRQQVPKAKRREDVKTEPIIQAKRVDTDDKPTDDTSIPPTSSLVNMFEQSRTEPKKSPPPVRSPQPQRAFRLPPEPRNDDSLGRQMSKTPPRVKAKPKPLSDPAHSIDGAVDSALVKTIRKDTFGTPPMRKPAELAAIKTTNTRPKPPPQRISQPRPKSEDLTGPVLSRTRTLSSSLSQQDTPSSPSSFVSARETQEEKPKPKPALPPPRRSARPAQESTQRQSRPKTATPLLVPPTTRARAHSKPTSPIPSPLQSTPPRRASVSGTATPTGTLYHSNYQRESVRAITKHLTGESLSNAIMGAALASSRNASPAPPASLYSPSPLSATPPLPMRRHHFSHSPFGRSPSPPKPKPQPSGKLRTTMRKDPSSSSDEESDKYKRKGTRIMGMGRKHPNKHHEGTRKRWRDQITERERKRYEGVWAANKGLYISVPSSSHPSSADDDPTLDVSNVVTHEIWSRSRLPDSVLEEVWDLVDSRGIGRLKREEFVVGLWLIDQRLKGRKLPIKVSDSVWGSVRGATGVKVKVSEKLPKAHIKKPLS